MILYEVNLSIDPSIYAAYKSWLPEHINAILKLPGFISAEIRTVDADCNSPEAPARTLISVLYYIQDRASLDLYFKNHATSMRKAASDLFGDQFSATRRVMELSQNFHRAANTHS